MLLKRGILFLFVLERLESYSFASSFSSLCFAEQQLSLTKIGRREFSIFDVQVKWKFWLVLCILVLCMWLSFLRYDTYNMEFSIWNSGYFEDRQAVVVSIVVPGLVCTVQCAGWSDLPTHVPVLISDIFQKY